ncbi:chorismate-binding protein, partial [Escherichia coli]|nr:chorismate-binding protein [Escherichia coli]
LFFTFDATGLTAKPMKGTARRGATAAEDDALAAHLAADIKQRAENLMIVDLMRNDLARIARPGTVRVPALFAVERYPT